MKNTYFILIMVFFSFTQNATGQSNINKTVHFNVDEYTLSKSAEDDLLNLIHILKGSNESDLKIVGHTDQDGSVEYNMNLSQKRAEAVQQFIVNEGYPSVDIQLNFLGESNLLADANDQQSMQKNRRVTVVANMYNYDSVSEFVSLLESNGPDKVTIDQKQPDEINLSNGTLVKLPAQAFCNMDGSPLENDKVEMIFKEAFDYTQMLDERLSTQTADYILETGGMVYIEASQNGIPVKLKDGKEIELIFPKQNRKDGMELFTGVSTDEGVIWEETGKKIDIVKEEPFIQVDISPITDYKFNFQDTIAIPYESMSPYPKAQRKPYPPAKIRYSEDKYTEVYQKYEDVLAKYYSDKIEMPERLKVWKKELVTRKDLLIRHKKQYTKKHVQRWLKYNIEKITSSSETVSHIKILGELNSFLDREVGETNYDDLFYRNKMFKGVSREILNKYNVYQPHLDDEPLRDFCAEFTSAMYVVNRRILDKKMELGYVDQKLSSRYIVSTSRLGWINCDRFLKMEEEEKMELNFADTYKGKDYYLVFKDIKSLIRPRKENGRIIFGGMPIGAEVKLVSLEVKNNECFLASQDLTLGSNNEIDLQHRKVGLTEVREFLEDI